MRVSDYEDRVKHKKMRIVKRQDREDGLTVLISQGYSKPDREDPEPHYKVEYAIFRDMEFCDIAEFYTIPVSPITTLEERIATAQLRADQAIEVFKKVGRYG